MDVYLNVAGGCASPSRRRIWPPRLLVSALTDQRLPPEAVFFGEFSLSGAIRPVSQPRRLKEAAKLGFATAYAPSMVQRGRRIGHDCARGSRILRHSPGGCSPRGD